MRSTWVQGTVDSTVKLAILTDRQHQVLGEAHDRIIATCYELTGLICAKAIGKSAPNAMLFICESITRPKGEVS